LKGFSTSLKPQTSEDFSNNGGMLDPDVSVYDPHSPYFSKGLRLMQVVHSGAAENESLICRSKIFLHATTKWQNFSLRWEIYGLNTLFASRLYQQIGYTSTVQR
jgi:hypothetical protein